MVDRITTGGFFGWSALVEHRVYVMSAVCKELSIVVAISGFELLALFDKDYYIGYKVFQSLSRIIGTRLRDMEQVLLKGKMTFPREARNLRYLRAHLFRYCFTLASNSVGETGFSI